MSEDSFVTFYNERNNFQGNSQTIADLYESCHKLQSDVTSLRKQNIELEGELVSQKNLQTVVERKYQRAVQDMEHYKIKNLIEKPVNNDDFYQSMHVEYDNVYKINEQSIKKNLEIEMKYIELQHNYRELEQQKYDVEKELDDMEIKYDNLYASYEELKLFFEEKKSEILDMQSLKSKINELEKLLNSNDKSDSSIYLGFAKIDELEVKCFKLENENKKYKENHMNLLLLVEENSSLTSKIHRLEERLINFDSHGVSQYNDTDCGSTIDVPNNRRSRHLEKENEILKSEQVKLVENNSELTAKINSMTDKIRSLEEKDEMYDVLVEQNKKRLEMVEHELHYLTRECDSYKKVLFQFSEQSSNEDVAELLSDIGKLYMSIDSHRRISEQQSRGLDQLTHALSVRLEKYNDNDNKSSYEEIAKDKKMIFDLRQQLEQLYDELDKKSQLIEEMNRKSCVEDNSIDLEEDITIDSNNYNEMGFCRNAAVSADNEKNRKIFKKLTNELLESVRQIMGYSIELGPNGYFAVQNCLAEDPSQILEFKTGDIPTLLDNTYAMSVVNEIDFKSSFPVLLAKITLDLVEKSENFMS